MPPTLPSVVLVGRPNVGKSTLFNRIIGARRAIVAPIAGTTRDSLSVPASWRGISFQLADTGGLYGASADPLHELVVQQGKRAIAGADLLVFLVDGREGLIAGDETIAKEIRRTGLPVVLAVNKTDDKRGQAGVSDFYQLGIEPVVEISAEHGNGVGDLLDEIGIKLSALGFKPETPAPADEAESRRGRLERSAPAGELDTTVGERRGPHDATIAIVGRPNVGKSSLLNRLLNEERVMVSDMPGTTRDAIDATLTWHRR